MLMRVLKRVSSQTTNVNDKFPIYVSFISVVSNVAIAVAGLHYMYLPAPCILVIFSRLGSDEVG